MTGHLRRSHAIPGPGSVHVPRTSTTSFAVQ
jgi:hypothetical protein